MRALMLLTAFLAAGCASQATNPQTASGAGQISTVDAGRLAQAKSLNLKLVNKDGQQVFCRSNWQTGSHIQQDTTCYTAEQLDKLEAQQQRDLDRLERNSAVGGVRSP